MTLCPICYQINSISHVLIDVGPDGKMDAAAIEQMNKVRASLGMAPLPVPGKDAGLQFKSQDDASDESDDMSTLDKRQAAAGSNWQKLEDERREKAERQRRKDAAKKARDAAQRYAKLEGKGLGDADEEEEAELDTRSWLKQQKRRQEKIEKARKLEEELAEREKQLAEYTSKDLAGVKVAHEVDEFDETGGEQVLTLKDTEIGSESDDDELENAELRAKEKLEERLRLKKKRPDYDPTDQEEAKNILSKYDEEIDGKKKKLFTLDGKGTSAASTRKILDSSGEVKGKGVKINLDMLKDDAPVSDYVDPSTIKVKKPKKKKEKKTRQKAADEDDIFPLPQAATETDNERMEIDGARSDGAVTSKKRAFEFEDDDDLQARLAEQRRSALKKRKKLDATELARQMREEMPVDEEEPEEGGLVLDETSEFVANLQRPEEPSSKPASAQRPQQAIVASPEEDHDDEGDTTMGQSYAEVEEAAERRASAAPEHTATGLDEEESVTSGVAATLGMLRKRGLVETTDEGLSMREQQRREFLAGKQHLIDDWDRKAKIQREADRKSGRLDKMSNRDRDAYARQQNEAREAYISRLLADKFNKEYKPNVKLEYHDEFGRSMNQKEAFKHMSHMFHGKGSGKQKTEKRLKKIEDEKKEMSKGMLTVADEGGMAGVVGREGRKQKQAGVRLQ